MESAISTAVASTTETITTVFTANIGLVMAIFGGLVALGLMIAYVKRHVGRK